MLVIQNLRPVKLNTSLHHEEKGQVKGTICTPDEGAKVKTRHVKENLQQGMRNRLSCSILDRKRTERYSISEKKDLNIVNLLQLIGHI